MWQENEKKNGVKNDSQESREVAEWTAQMEYRNTREGVVLAIKRV